MAQVTPRSTFGYSARVLFGKDHRRLALENNNLDNTVNDCGMQKEGEPSDIVKKLLKYMSVLRASSGRQFDNVLGRLHWMLKTSGSELDQQSEDSVDEAYETLRDMVMERMYSRSSRWKIMELLELRANNWEDGDVISAYYEDPANIMMPETVSNNNPSKPSPHAHHVVAHCLPYQARPNRLYIPTPSPAVIGGPRSPQSVQSNNSAWSNYSHSSASTPSPESLRTRTLSGDSVSLKTDASGCSRRVSGGRSRNTSGSSSGMLTFSRSGSMASAASRRSSCKSAVEEDVFRDSDDKFTDDSDGSDDGSISPSISAAKYRLMQINSGKPIRYTSGFLLGCWSSPLCQIMPSNLMHTIKNSDIGYIIKGPPFEDPARLFNLDSEPPAPPVKRSISLPAGPASLSSAPVREPGPAAYVRSRSSSDLQPKLGRVAHYDVQRHVPVLCKEEWQSLFKNAIRKIDREDF